MLVTWLFNYWPYQLLVLLNRCKPLYSLNKSAFCFYLGFFGGESWFWKREVTEDGGISPAPRAPLEAVELQSGSSVCVKQLRLMFAAEGRGERRTGRAGAVVGMTFEQSLSRNNTLPKVAMSAARRSAGLRTGESELRSGFEPFSFRRWTEIRRREQKRRGSARFTPLQSGRCSRQERGAEGGRAAA